MTKPDRTRRDLATAYRRVRETTERLAAPVPPEEQVIQSMTDASPVKWHRAHTSWFFEEFVLGAFAPDYQPFDPDYRYLFNSYYEGVGARHERTSRGMVGRPDTAEVGRYREHVDQAVLTFIDSADSPTLTESAGRIQLGLNHEQQHQELMMTDLLHALACNPVKPAYRSYHASEARMPVEPKFVGFAGGEYEIGIDAANPPGGFAYDNEGPPHLVSLSAFALADRPVINREWLEFIEDGGYRRPELWLADGWGVVQQEGWRAPMYWQQDGDSWRSMTLSGMQEINSAAPVAHISFYEADAFARWAGKRLPSEAEWEIAAREVEADQGNFLDSGFLRPLPDSGPQHRGSGLRQLFGDVWEWTQSAYLPYPGYRPDAGAIGEYNGKFMCNQMVLRGGSCVTPSGHVRAGYRNFFYPHQRWQFAGLRLAEDR